MKKSSLVFLLFISISLLSPAQENQSAEQIETAEAGDDSKTELNQNLIVSKINFIGLKRTKDSHVQSKVSKYKGKPLSEIDMHKFETDIQLIGLFDDIHYSTEQISDTEAQINVSVKEKITFIPMPFAMYSTSTGFMAGGVVLDSNLFGKQYMFNVGTEEECKVVYHASGNRNLLQLCRNACGVFKI